MKFYLSAENGSLPICQPLIQKLSRLTAQFDGPDIFVKRDDFTGIECSGNKVRKLEFVAAYALQEQCDVLITCGGIQSNHSRAPVARLGLKSHLVLRGTASDVLSGIYFDQITGSKDHLFIQSQLRGSD